MSTPSPTGRLVWNDPNLQNIPVRMTRRVLNARLCRTHAYNAADWCWLCGWCRICGKVLQAPLYGHMPGAPIRGEGEGAQKP